MQRQRCIRDRAQLTGDHDLLVEDLRPDQTRMLEPEAGITPEEATRGRDLAAAALARFRDAGAVPAPTPTGAELRTLMALSLIHISEPTRPY